MHIFGGRSVQILCDSLTSDVISAEIFVYRVIKLQSIFLAMLMTEECSLEVNAFLLDENITNGISYMLNFLNDKLSKNISLSKKLKVV